METKELLKLFKKIEEQIFLRRNVIKSDKGEANAKSIVYKLNRRK
ncbi:hypothetical protein [Clostridium perfringens]|nr:hypothetical protein [Clostridium perfringens]